MKFRIAVQDNNSNNKAYIPFMEMQEAQFENFLEFTNFPGDVCRKLNRDLPMKEGVKFTYEFIDE